MLKLAEAKLFTEEQERDIAELEADLDRRLVERRGDAKVRAMVDVVVAEEMARRYRDSGWKAEVFVSADAPVIWVRHPRLVEDVRAKLPALRPGDSSEFRPTSLPEPPPDSSSVRRPPTARPRKKGAKH